jgi:hypothetical protein
VRCLRGAQSCPSASAANQGCPAAKVRMLWVHRRRLSTVYPLLWLSFGSGPPRFASGIKDTSKEESYKSRTNSEGRRRGGREGPHQGVTTHRPRSRAAPRPTRAVDHPPAAS